MAAEPSSESFIKKYLFSSDHKTIGLQYYFLALFSALLSTTLSVVMRTQLAWPDSKWPLLAKLLPRGFKDGVMMPEFYLATMTMHGTLMIFFVLNTAPQNGFGHYFLPLQIGARRMIFPRLSMFSFWTTVLALLVLLAAFFVEGGAPISGWTAYPPLSIVGQQTEAPPINWGQNLWLISLLIFCLASIMAALNIAVTLLSCRARGMSLMRLPLTCWTWFATSLLSLLAFPVLFAGGLLLLLDRVAGTSFFLPDNLLVNGQLIERSGGLPILWQHLFWFFGHPEVYIAILPGMGVVSQILATFARKPLFGYRAMVIATIGIGLLGLLVWGHHMFVSGMNPYSGMTFSFLTLAVGVPSAIKTFNWLGTLWGGSLRFTSAMLFAIGFVSLFVAGGLSGIFLGQSALDVYLHDTYFVVGHFHLIMGVAAIFGIFAGSYYWFPKMFGRKLDEGLGKLHFWLTFLGVYVIFFPMYLLGMAGNPRRYAQLMTFEYLQQLQPLHVLISIAAFVTITAQLLFVLNLFYSIFEGETATENPWQATTLEWTTSSPPPVDNFPTHAPIVYRGAYDYSLPGATSDYLMQTEPNAPPGSEEKPDTN